MSPETSTDPAAPPPFDHFLLTRFSAVLAPGAAPASEEWLRYRLAFFVDAAHPSVVGQRGAAFTWLVLFDDRCPDTFRADVEALAADGSFTPLWSHEPFRRDTFAASVAARSAAPYLITTRLDSDDAIATDYLAAVQGQFAHQDSLFVSFTRGLQVDRSGAVHRCDQLSNPFLSLIERRLPGAPPLTVYAPKHARARTQGPLREVQAPPMWLQVVHDANVSNIVTGTRVAPDVVARRFTIDLGYRRDVPLPRLLAEKAAQRARLARLWAAHPGELTRYVEAPSRRHRPPSAYAGLVADFDHFLLTRFSAVFDAAAPPAPEDWLYYRLGFFVDAAHPSVVGQRGAAFTWLVVFDDRCPDGFRAEVEALAADGSFTPLWTHRTFHAGLFGEAIAARSAAPYLITSRLDSDDALARDFMAAVQRQFAHQARLFLSFTRGVQLDRAGRVYRRDEISNPFLSLIERRTPGERPATVYVAAAHTRARAHGPVREVAAPPMWAQVVHGTNLYNVVSGTRISPRVVNERFTLDLAYRREVPMARLLLEKAQHRARLTRFWFRHPSEPLKYAEARYWRLRGTHERPQGDGRTLMDRVLGRTAAISGRRHRG